MISVIAPPREELITGEELFATAGHCLKPTGAPKSDPALECKDVEFAFGFQVRSFATEHPVEAIPFWLRRKWDVYKCKEVVARAEPLLNQTSGDKSDFTLFKADRVVRGRRRLDVRRTSTLEVGEGEGVVGLLRACVACGHYRCSPMWRPTRAKRAKPSRRMTTAVTKVRAMKSGSGTPP